jgi:hypothetical protein
VNDLTGLYAGYQAGLYTLPDVLVGAYELLADAQTRLRDRDPAITPAQVQRLHERAAKLVAYGNGDQVITDHLQPALTRLMEPFIEDVNTLGQYAGHANLTPDLVKESDEVRDAYARYLRAGDWYAPLRQAWRRCRGGQPCDDPRGVDSLLAEFANLPDLYARWDVIGAVVNGGLVIAPWQGSADYLRLAWAVRAGATVWLPTTAQQSQAYRTHTRPTTPASAGSTHTERLTTIAAT